MIKDFFELILVINTLQSDDNVDSPAGSRRSSEQVIHFNDIKFNTINSN